MKRKITLLAVLLTLAGCGKKEAVNEEIMDTEREDISAETEQEYPWDVMEGADAEISDFTASVLEKEHEDGEDNFVITLSEGKEYKLEISHPDQVYEINFYGIGKADAENENYAATARKYLSTYYPYLPMDKAYIRCGADDENPVYILSFMTKGGQIFEYATNGESPALKQIPSVNMDEMIQYEGED